MEKLQGVIHSGQSGREKRELQSKVQSEGGCLGSRRKESKSKTFEGFGAQKENWHEKRGSEKGKRTLRGFRERVNKGHLEGGGGKKRCTKVCDPNKGHKKCIGKKKN